MKERCLLSQTRRHFQRVRSNKYQLKRTVRLCADSDLPIRQLGEHSRTLSNKPKVVRSATIHFKHNMKTSLISMGIKPRPNDSNISTQHIPTLLAQHLQAPAKQRSQHLNATDRNIVGRNMLHAFGQPVATCWNMLKIELVRMPKGNIVARTWPNDYNIMQHPQMLHEKFDHFQI